MTVAARSTCGGGEFSVAGARAAANAGAPPSPLLELMPVVAHELEHLLHLRAILAMAAARSDADEPYRHGLCRAFHFVPCRRLDLSHRDAAMRIIETL